jgi:hypothetical protein
VVNVAKNFMYHFMDGFLRYKQIKMVEKDKQNTIFIIPWGTYCYKVMPFRIKNIRATYQFEMMTLFHNIMLTKIKAFEDYMITNYKQEEYHIQILRKLSVRL